MPKKTETKERWTEAELAKLAASMPPLNGAPLTAPRLVDMGWVRGQCFTMEDDPDRMQEPWQGPSFIYPATSGSGGDSMDTPPSTPPRGARVTAAAKAAAARADAVDIVPPVEAQSKIAKDSFIRVVHNVLTPSECEALLASVNAKGFTPALLNIGAGRQILEPAGRDGHRAIIDSPELTDFLFHAVKDHLPENLRSGLKLRGLNERCRFLCYTPGQQFPPHCDGHYRRPKGHPRYGEGSRVTLQLYLHDVPKKNGGATTFIWGNQWKRDCSSSETPYHPTCGSVLMFTQDLLHEGSLLSSGLKYTMRTEAMYVLEDD